MSLSVSAPGTYPIEPAPRLPAMAHVSPLICPAAPRPGILPPAVSVTCRMWHCYQSSPVRGLGDGVRVLALLREVAGGLVAFTAEWTTTPIDGLWCRPRPLDTEPLSGYAVAPGGLVGPRVPLGVRPAELFPYLEADDDAWQRVPDGPDASAPLVLIRLPGTAGSGPGEYWLDRGLLADPLCEATTRRIDDADRDDRRARAGLPRVPAAADGDRAACRAEAARLRLAVPLGPDQVMEAFADAPPPFPVVDWVPQTRWLAEGSLHYVGEDDMGAVLVLKHLSASVAETSRARRADPAAFARGQAAAGACVDGELFIQRRDMGTGVEYHEAVHALSHWAMTHVLGTDFTEGVTEYFARVVTEPLARAGRLIPAPAHIPQLAGICALTELGIRPLFLARAYFGGDLQPLFTAFAALTGGLLSLQGYASRLGDRTAGAAGQVLRDIAGSAPVLAALR